MERKTIDHVQEIAKSRGFILLSSVYVNSKTKYLWQCSKGHRWLSQYGPIRDGCGCSVCSGHQNEKPYLRNLAKRFGFEYIENKISHTYKWRCKEGHEWTAYPGSLKEGKGCPFCKKNVRKEDKCRFVFEQLTGKKFIKTRKALNGRLELDGYCKELKLAFEYNGPQHYEEHFWHSHSRDKTETFEKQKERDARKSELCRELGIKKIDIPYYECKNHKSIQQLISKAINIYKDIDWNLLKFAVPVFDEICKLASKKGFKCLSDSYLGATTKLLWQCKNGHKWESSPSNIKRYGCPYCSRKAKKTIQDMKELATTRGFEFLSEIYINIMTKHLWKCSRGHHFMSRPNDIQNGLGCPQCWREHCDNKRRLKCST